MKNKSIIYRKSFITLTCFIFLTIGLKAQEIKKEWMAGLLPNIQLMPSGVWAVGRAQEHGCSYCFAG